MVMTKGGNVDPTNPRANVVGQQPFTAPSTPAPETDQRIGDAPIHGVVEGQQSGGGWDAADADGSFWA